MEQVGTLLAAKDPGSGPERHSRENVSLGIESGIHNIQTQHIGECVYDSIQAIMFFADGFRELYANYAEDCLNRLPSNDLFQLTSVFEADVVRNFFPAGATAAGASGKDIEYLKRFYSRATRRYILVKLQECGWSPSQVETYFKTPTLTTDCLLPYPVKARSLQRQASFNKYAGVTTADPIMKLVGVDTIVKNGMLKTEGLMSEQVTTFIGVLNKNDKFWKNNVEVQHEYTPDAVGRLVGIQIGAFSESGGHSNAIVRYRGAYYYCDNEMGVAHRIDETLLQEPLNSRSFSYGAKEGKWNFMINGKVAVSFPISGGIGDDLFKSESANFFFLKEGVDWELPAEGGACTKPPALPTSTFAVAPTAPSRIFHATQSRFSAHQLPTAAQTGIRRLGAFPKTRKVIRYEMVSSVGPSAAPLKRFTATRRAGR